ncbi:hypothetical protein AN958_06244 [Leucoagaricus sp. SymC.cos]|nr:hypothetical protein AN958_06244 [Leucoagaricus sp. SymC.cos]
MLNSKLNFKPCGSFCFSKDRNNLISVIPTLAYQLIDYSSQTIAPSPQFPKDWNPYSYALATELADDPLLLWKSPRVQLQKMIIEPLLKLQVEGWLNHSPPFLIVLDRIDECGEDSQRELVAMISDAMRVYYDRLPLLWLISSPREKRLEKVFTDEVPGWHRAELIKSQKSNQKMPEGFDGVKSLKGHVKSFFERLARLPRQFTQSKFIFRGIPTESKQLRRACIDNVPALRDALIFNQDALVETGAVPHRNPFEQFWYCFSYLETHNNLTEGLRFFFEDTLRNASGTTNRVLTHFMHLNSNMDSSISAQTFCNFLEMTKTNFYDVLDKLESLIIVPPPEAIADKPLEADDSFMTYLQSGIRIATQPRYFSNTADLVYQRVRRNT